MALYKGIELHDDLHGLIRYMSSVEEYREILQNLQGVWDNLTLLGQLSGTGTDMTGTRQAFHQLTGNLLNNLGQETLKKSVLEMKSKAQVAVDIMIRNLFERTADIGFLATDDDLRDYLEQAPELRRKVAQSYGSDKAALTEELDALNDRLMERFAEYVRKYSVYFNILLLDPEGRVLIQLDPHNPVTRSEDSLVAESLATGGAYVETFRHTDLLPEEPASLVYSYRVTSRDGERMLGVLCLAFRFRNETEGIFANLREEDDWSVITLLDHEGTVIASSEECHIPVGAKMETVLDADCRVVRFAGREYLAATRPTKGYQGYMGPGWYGHVMVPIEHAFDKDASALLQRVPPDALEAVMNNPSLFAEGLRNIPLQAEQIQRELNRSVWNGNVRQSSDKKALNPAFSKVLLWEISNTGLKTKDVFERSIGNLHQTVVSAILLDSRFLASLSIDIMDRNLYERANDCRWWALTSAFRERLAKETWEEGDTQAVTAILSHINGLYTVYSNLVLFNRQGRVVAVSNPDYAGFVGKGLGDDWVRQTLGLGDSQQYAVSAFAPSPLYGGRHTYIYGAAVRHPTGDGVVGGIGIVFDAAPQFDAMLRDALPRNEKGEIPAGCFGVFADRERTVIASTREDIVPGTALDLDSAFFNLARGAGTSNIVELGGHYYAVGSRMSQGYREYKGPEDAYRNDVVALVFVPLGEAAAIRAAFRPPARQRLSAKSRESGFGETVEIATFHLGEHWFGVPSEQVVEAIDASGITQVPGSTRCFTGYVMFRGSPIPVVSLNVLLHAEATLPEGVERQIVVVRESEEQEYLGILVDSLGEIPEVPAHRIEKISAMLAGDNMLAESIVKSEADGHLGEMLVVLAPERIRQRTMQARLQEKAGAGAPLLAQVPPRVVPMEAGRERTPETPTATTR